MGTKILGQNDMNQEQHANRFGPINLISRLACSVTAMVEWTG
jgi:hypothetical protein